LRKTTQRLKDKDCWRLPLRTFSGDYLDRAIKRTGLYDIALTELIWKLTNPVGLQVDVGANIGYITRLMLRKTQSGGRVISFECNPEILPVLQENIHCLNYAGKWSLVAKAAGDQMGKIELERPAIYANNKGTAYITHIPSANSTTIYQVTLDNYFSEGHKIDLLKIDVEGAEERVLLGAQNLLRTNRIDHIIYEDHAGYPSKVGSLLEEYGFTTYAIQKGWWGLKLKRAGLGFDTAPWEEPNFLATLLSGKAVKLLEAGGYTCLHTR